ncbi:MAG: helix-turn-helix domain-containing protein [Pseudomonadota bacterium]
MNQETETVAEEPDEKTPRISPGQKLRAARKARELSVKQVANELHLTMHYVNALESDDFDTLPGDVFVKGYIRNYAQLLQLDPDQILKHYRELGERRQARKEEAFDRYTQRRKNRNRPWVITSGMAFVALALLLWYLSGSSGEAPPAVDAGNGANEPVQRSTDTSTLSGAVRALSGEVQAQELAAVAESASTRASASEETGLPTVASRTLSWGGPDSLQLLLASDSRVTVREADDRNDSEETMKGGEMLRVDGTAPFDVDIDQAAGARLTFNGRNIDVDGIVRDDGSARLTIGF